MEENTVGKGEIARYKQFLLSNSVFKRFVLQTHKNQGLFEKGLKCPSNDRLVLGWVENNVCGKQRICWFLHFPQCFQNPPFLGSLKVGLCDE